MNYKKDKIVKVKTSDLKTGMYVVDVGRGWLHHPWKTRKKKITSIQEINQLVEHGIEEVAVDLSQSDAAETLADREFGITQKAVNEALKVPARQVSRQVQDASAANGLKNISQLERRKAPRPQKPLEEIKMEEELPNAIKTYNRALDLTHQLISDIKTGQKIKVTHVKECVDDMIDSVFRNRSALTSLLKLQNYDDYTFTHSINVAIYAISVGRHLSFNRNQLLSLGMGAVLHDVGKTGIPDEILNKPSRLTDDEFEIMKRHPVIGAEIVSAQEPEFSKASLNIIRHHHEKTDGSGYPHGMRESELDPFIIIAGLSDIYDALASDRVYHKGMLPHEALKVIFSMRGKHFPQSWVDRFVQCMGIYPPGSLVELNDGCAGFVYSVNQSNLTRPQVKVVTNQKKKRLMQETVIDLNTFEYEKMEIIAVLDPNALGLETKDYYPVQR